MSNNVKDINIKTQTYYLFDGIINIFHLNNINIAEESCKNIPMYHVGYIRTTIE